MNLHYDEALRHSKRRARRQRQEKARLSILLACVTLVLTLATLAVFIFCMIADLANNDAPGGNTPAPNNIAPTVSITQDASGISKGVLLLVNYINDGNKHYFDPASAKDLKIIDGTQGSPRIYTVADTSWTLNAETLAAFNTMMQKYYEISEGDGTIKVSSAYRNAAMQEGKSTPVGYSDHHTGYCLALRTVSGGHLADDHWIYENGHKYGFIVRYPNSKQHLTGVSDYEYCIRYVGVAHATYMAENNLCLEEYIDRLQSSTNANAPLSVKGADGCDYQIFYTPKATGGTLTTITFPKGYEYTVSGDNEGGFIVTVNLSRPTA